MMKFFLVSCSLKTHLAHGLFKIADVLELTTM